MSTCDCNGNCRKYGGSCQPITPGGAGSDNNFKIREGDQPLPIPNKSVDIQSLVLADIEARRQIGISRYGTALQPFNGRDMLRDAYEEALDLAIYLRGVISERDGK